MKALLDLDVKMAHEITRKSFAGKEYIISINVLLCV